MVVLLAVAVWHMHRVAHALAVKIDVGFLGNADVIEFRHINSRDGSSIVDATAYRRVDGAQRNPPNAAGIWHGSSAWWIPARKAPHPPYKKRSVPRRCSSSTGATCNQMLP